MTLDEIENRLREISRHKDDPEHAHGLEDKLWEDVLAHIANNDGMPLNSLYAREALKTKRISFPRHRA